jgi:hypothetical protein
LIEATRLTIRQHRKHSKSENTSFTYLPDSDRCARLFPGSSRNSEPLQLVYVLDLTLLKPEAIVASLRNIPYIEKELIPVVESKKEFQTRGFIQIDCSVNPRCLFRSARTPAVGGKRKTRSFVPPSLLDTHETTSIRPVIGEDTSAMGIVLSTLRFLNFDLSTTQDAPVDGRKHIVIIGGSYGGMSVINNLKKLLSGDVNENRPADLPSLPNLPRRTPRITLIDERDGIYHTMGTPLVHSSPDIAKTVPRAWKRYSDIPYLQDVCVVQGRVVNLDAELKEVTYSFAGKEHKMGYDYVVCSTGMQRDWPAQPRATTKDEYFEDATSFVDGLLEKDRIVVIGGGSSTPRALLVA